MPPLHLRRILARPDKASQSARRRQHAIHFDHNDNTRHAIDPRHRPR